MRQAVGETKFSYEELPVVVAISLVMIVEPFVVGTSC